MHNVTGQHFYVGAEVSVLSVSLSGKRQLAKTSPLRAVNGASISTYVQRSLTIEFGLCRTF